MIIVVDIISKILVIICYGLSFFLSVQHYFREVEFLFERRVPVALTWIISIVYWISSITFVYIESGKLKAWWKGEVVDKSYRLFELKYTIFAISLFFPAILSYLNELYIYTITSMDSRIVNYVTIQLILNFVLFSFAVMYLAQSNDVDISDM